MAKKPEKKQICKTEYGVTLNTSYNSLGAILTELECLIEKYGDLAILDNSPDYDGGQSDSISYSREETDEEFEKRIAAEQKARVAMKEDAQDYIVYLELKARYEK